MKPDLRRRRCIETIAAAQLGGNVVINRDRWRCASAMTVCGKRPLIIFDFDGVIADSEILANTVLAEVVSELGVPTTLEDALSLYMGKRFHEVVAAIEAAVGRPLPEHFPDDFQQRTLSRFRQDLRLVEGAQEFIEAFPDIPRCIASSSSSDRLALCLDVLNITRLFANVFSASEVARGKPHPDIFLHAAKTMAVDPAQCIVIEDSAGGVRAGVAAGMTVIGLLAASHVRAGHAQRLQEAGAHHLARSFDDVRELTRVLISS